MSAKRKIGLGETVRDAATGYAVVVLSVICFLLVLFIAVAGVRIVAGGSLASITATAASQNIAHAAESETT